MELNKECSFCGSDERVGYSPKSGTYLCHKHYMQMYHTGKLTKNFRNSPSQIVLLNNHAEIIVLDKNKNEKGRVLIDLSDVLKCEKIRWTITKRGYCTGTINKKSIYIHRYLLNLTDNNLVPDHINGNRLDNRRCNLRIVTISQNNMNSKIPSNNTSGCKGVSLTQDGKWHSYLAVNRKRINLGEFQDINDAINARKEAEEKYYGEYSYDNSRPKR